MGGSDVSKLWLLGRRSVKFVRDGEQWRLATHINILLWSVLGVYPDTFDTNPHSVEKTLVHIPVASGSQWIRSNLEIR